MAPTYLPGVLHAGVPSALRRRLGTSAVFVGRRRLGGTVDVITDSYARLASPELLAIASNLPIELHLLDDAGRSSRRFTIGEVVAGELRCHRPRTVFALLWSDVDAAAYVSCDGGALVLRSPRGLVRCEPPAAAPTGVLQRLRKKDESGESQVCADALVRWASDAAEYLDVDEVVADALHDWVFASAPVVDEECKPRPAKRSKLMALAEAAIEMMCIAKLKKK